MELLYKNIESSIYSFYNILFNEYNNEDLEENRRIVLYQRIKVIKFLMAIITILKYDTSVTKESFKLKFLGLSEGYMETIGCITLDCERKKIQDEVYNICNIIHNNL